MKLSQLAAGAVVFLAGTAVEPAFAANDPDVVWKGDFDDGRASLTGHCSAGENGWCNAQIMRPEQIQLVSDLAFQGHGLAARLEVKFGDVYGGYSDERTLITPPNSMWEDPGNERWYRWQAMWPDGWVGDYPKWDQLTDPTARSSAGSIVEWHHDGDGPAPLYIGANNTNLWMCLVDFTTRLCRESLDLAPLLRGHWHDFVMHASRLPRDVDRRRQRTADASSAEHVPRREELHHGRSLPERPHRRPEPALARQHARVRHGRDAGCRLRRRFHRGHDARRGRPAPAAAPAAHPARSARSGTVPGPCTESSSRHGRRRRCGERDHVELYRQRRLCQLGTSSGAALRPSPRFVPPASMATRALMND